VKLAHQEDAEGAGAGDVERARLVDPAQQIHDRGGIMLFVNGAATWWPSPTERRVLSGEVGHARAYPPMEREQRAVDRSRHTGSSPEFAKTATGR
jgi:hypothetical protein